MVCGITLGQIPSYFCYIFNVSKKLAGSLYRKDVSSSLLSSYYPNGITAAIAAVSPINPCYITTPEKTQWSVIHKKQGTFLG